MLGNVTPSNKISWCLSFYFALITIVPSLYVSTTDRAICILNTDQVLLSHIHLHLTTVEVHLQVLRCARTWVSKRADGGEHSAFVSGITAAYTQAMPYALTSHSMTSLNNQYMTLLV